MNDTESKVKWKWLNHSANTFLNAIDDLARRENGERDSDIDLFLLRQTGVSIGMLKADIGAWMSAIRSYPFKKTENRPGNAEDGRQTAPRQE